MSERVYVYGLVDPITSQLRYVGQTTNLKKRLQRHLGETRVNSHRRAWIKSLESRGLTPEIFVIEETTVDGWVEAEKFWISYFRYIGVDLVNHSDGGDGQKTCHLTIETKQIMSAAAKRRYADPSEREKTRQSQIGRTITVEHRANMSRALKGRVAPNKGMPMSEEQRELMRQIRTGTKHTPEALVNIANANRATLSDPETKEKLRQATAASWNDEQVRQARLAGMKLAFSKPEARVKRSELSKRLWADPDFREKMMASRRKVSK